MLVALGVRTLVCRPERLLLQKALKFRGGCSAMYRMEGVPAASSGGMCPRPL